MKDLLKEEIKALAFFIEPDDKDVIYTRISDVKRFVKKKLQAIQVQAEVVPQIAEDKLNKFKSKLSKVHANMVTYFKPKENQVILDFIATISKEDL